MGAVIRQQVICSELKRCLRSCKLHSGRKIHPPQSSSIAFRLQQKSVFLSARVQKETSARNQKETDLEGVFSEDFGPDVEGWFWRMCNGPEVAQGVMDEGD